MLTRHNIHTEWSVCVSALPSLSTRLAASVPVCVCVCLCFATIRLTCQIWVANLRNTRHSDCFRNPWMMWWCIKCPDWTLNIDICAGLFRLRQRLSEDRCSIRVTFAKIIIIYLCRSCYENLQHTRLTHQMISPMEMKISKAIRSAWRP